MLEASVKYLLVTFGSGNVKGSLSVIVNDIRVSPFPQQYSESIPNTMFDSHMNRSVACAIRHISSSPSVKQELDSLYVTTFYSLQELLSTLSCYIPYLVQWSSSIIILGIDIPSIRYNMVKSA